MTLDERLEALTQSVELLASMQRENEARLTAMQERESRGRTAVLAGIAAYLETLQEGGKDG